MMEDLIGMTTKHLTVGGRAKIVGLGILQCEIVLREWAGILDRRANSDQGQQKGCFQAPPTGAQTISMYVKATAASDA